MKNRMILLFFLCSACFFSLLSQDKFAQSLELIELQHPWIDAGNSAGLLTLDSLSLSEFQLFTLLNDGDFKSVYAGQRNTELNVQTKSYRNLKQSVVYGEFEYANSLEHKLRFNNINDPSNAYPYLLIDTLGATDYHREEIHLAAGFATPISDAWQWGAGVKYTLGTAYQTNDPRALNKFQDIFINPGIRLKLLNHQFGLNLNYAYYNEDVDLSIVQEGKVHTFFQLHGLGHSNDHSANNYKRLYDRDTWGGGLQWSAKRKAQVYLTGINAHVSLLDVKDGRAGGDARWSVVKDDALLHGQTFEIYHSASLYGHDYFQRIRLNMAHQTQLGKEPVQRLEKSDVSDVMQWQTYAEESKYYAKNFQTTVKYDYVRFYKNQSLKSHLKFDSRYLGVEEEYYIPDSYVRYQNLTLNASFLKRWLFTKEAVSVEGRAGIRFDMGTSYRLDESRAIVQLVSLPNFIYLSTQYYVTGVGANYEREMEQLGTMLLLKTSADYYQADALGMQLWWRVSLGILF